MLQPDPGSTQVPQAQLFSQLSGGHIPREQVSTGRQVLHTHYSSPLTSHSERHPYPPQKVSLTLNLSEKRSARRTGDRSGTPSLPERLLMSIGLTPSPKLPIGSILHIISGRDPTRYTSADLRCVPRDVLQGESSWQLLSLKKKKTVHLQ